MKAAMLKTFGSPLCVESLTDPVLGTTLRSPRPQGGGLSGENIAIRNGRLARHSFLY